MNTETLTDTKDLQGYGRTAQNHGHRYFIGNQRLMEEQGILFPCCQHLGLAVHPAEDGNYFRPIEISDESKPTARETMTAMRRESVQRIVLLTGDRMDIAERTGKALGIGEVYVGLLPSGKVSNLETLLSASKRGSLVFVGDGINDAPCMRAQTWAWQRAHSAATQRWRLQISC
jgi:Zn2+/Cd2+-exporting ATPase